MMSLAWFLGGIAKAELAGDEIAIWFDVHEPIASRTRATKKKAR
jgi:hypothetical protein